VATEGKGASSFLGAIKQEVVDLFASAYDEISSDFGEEVPAVVPTALKTLQKKTWELFEKKCKESFLNGKKAGGNPSAKDGNPRKAIPPDREETATGSNPFRK